MCCDEPQHATSLVQELGLLEFKSGNPGNSRRSPANPAPALNPEKQASNKHRQLFAVHSAAQQAPFCGREADSIGWKESNGYLICTLMMKV